MKDLKEHYLNSVNLNSETEFPYLVLDVCNGRALPRNPGFQVMHWHEDLQFIYVLDGAIEVKTLEHSFHAEKGEGIFLNKSVVHRVRQIGSCHYNSFLFPAEFLGFYAGSPARRLVDSVTENDQISVYLFQCETDWCREIMSVLKRLSELERNKTDFYVYEVLTALCSLWLILRKNIALPHEKPKSAVSIRMGKVLRFIEEHYPEDITLEDLADSANISKSECTRCFKTCLNTTPYKYLMEFRLLKAAQFLRDTEKPVGRIAAETGFHQISHFGKCFKEKTGCSPRQYREMERKK